MSRTWIGIFYGCIVMLPFVRVIVRFVAACVTTNLVSPARDAPAVPPDAYAAAMIDAATADCGFRWRAAGVHPKFATLPAVLLVSADQTAIAFISAGMAGRISVLRTKLFTKLRGGRVLLSSDEGHGVELDPHLIRQNLHHADFVELWRFHAARLADQVPGEVVPFAADAGWPELQQIYADHADRLVAAGLARFADASRATLRYTIRGAFKATIVAGLKRQWTPIPQSRRFKARPGSAQHLRKQPTAQTVAETIEDPPAADAQS